MTYTKFDGYGSHIPILFTDASGVELAYLDGVYAGTRTYTRSIYASNKVSLGSNTVGSTSYYGNGWRGDTRIYNKILSAAEVKALYNSYYTEKIGPMFLR